MDKIKSAKCINVKRNVNIFWFTLKMVANALHVDNNSICTLDNLQEAFEGHGCGIIVVHMLLIWSLRYHHSDLKASETMFLIWRVKSINDFTNPDQTVSDEILISLRGRGNTDGQRRGGERHCAERCVRLSLCVLSFMCSVIMCGQRCIMTPLHGRQFQVAWLRGEGSETAGRRALSF